MAKTNVKVKAPPKKFTAEGARAYPNMKPIQALRRSVLSCLLWEKEFYEGGTSIADRISELSQDVTATELAKLAVEARTIHHLRHVPLQLLVELVKHPKAGGRLIGDAIFETIQRADELTEFLALYWKEGKVPLARQVKLGLARAFGKFNAYQLGKYNQDGAIKLRDVMFMVHPRPKDKAQGRMWKKLVDGTLPTPDTWEVALSGGDDKKETFERLIKEGQLGYLALLRNLRLMTQVGVNGDLIIKALLARKGAERVFPFRYVAAARACPQLERAIDEALCASIEELPKLEGKTVVLVDVSGSMNHALSGKSDLMRMDAAAALASLIPGDVRMFSFSNVLVEVPPRRGMAGVDAIIKSQPHGGTALAGAVKYVNDKVPCHRLIVITDEQATDGAVPDPVVKLAYMINVASNKNGVGYGKWIHLDGFSESVIRWIYAMEQTED